MLHSSEEERKSHREKFDSIFKERPCLTLLGAAGPVHSGPEAQLIHLTAAHESRV